MCGATRLTSIKYLDNVCHTIKVSSLYVFINENMANVLYFVVVAVEQHILPDRMQKIKLSVTMFNIFYMCKIQLHGVVYILLIFIFVNID